MITKESDLDEFLLICKKRDFIADCETDSLNIKTANLVGFSIAIDEGSACYIPLRHGMKKNNDLLSLENNILKKSN